MGQPVDDEPMVIVLRAAAVGLAIVTAVSGARRQALPSDGVLIDVAVTTNAGDAADVSLSPDDFVLTIDGRPVRVESVAAGVRPVTMLVVVDVTASLIFATDTLNRFRDAIDRSLLAHLAGGDRARMGSFGRRLGLGPAFSDDRQALRASLRDLLRLPADQRDGPSPIWDVLDEAVSAIEGEPGRRAIVLVTDGRSTGNRLALQAVVERAALAGVAISVIGEGAEARLARVEPDAGMPGHRAGPYLQSIARETGGLYFVDGLTDAWQRPEPGPFLETILGTMRMSYVVGFRSPTADGAAHRIDLRVTDASLRAHVRGRYRAPAATAAAPAP